MVWFLSILGISAVLGIAGAMVCGVRGIVRGTAASRLERRLHPSDVFELNQAFARVQRDVLYGD